jgi:2'-5' RNA ligase
MDEKVLCVLALFDEATNEKLESLHETLYQQGFIGTQTKNIPYHFTIGTYQTSQEAMLINLLDQVGRNTKYIDLRLNHIGLFGLKVLFIEPNMNYELLDLQRNFFEECTKGYHMWAAHATLLIDEADVISKALPIVAAEFQPMHSRIEKIALYEFFPARLIKEVDLQIS